MTTQRADAGRPDAGRPDGGRLDILSSYLPCPTEAESSGRQGKIWLRILYVITVVVMCVVTGSSLAASTSVRRLLSDTSMFNASAAMSESAVSAFPASRVQFQYRLSENVRLTICTVDTSEDVVVVDIRQFLNGKPTIKGINIQLDAFKTLELMWDTIIYDLHSIEARWIRD